MQRTTTWTNWRPIASSDGLRPASSAANEASTLSYSPESHQLRNRAAQAAEEIDLRLLLRVKPLGYAQEAFSLRLSQLP